MLASLGLFVFQLSSAPFHQLQRSTSWSWSKQTRVGKRSAFQFAGPGSDEITLSGTLAPAITGGRASLDVLRTMGDSGLAWPLVDGEGYIYGLFIIADINETRTELFADGAARKIDFTLKLERADDSTIDKIGALTRIGLGL